ncbi:MAG: hypothetical protein ABI383_11665 [Acidobacteriaceae bacterium]
MKKLSKFNSEAEEAAWWYDHQDDIAQAFIEAEQHGTLRHGTVARLAAEHLPSNVLLPDHDLELARKQAQAVGVDPEDYIRSLLHEALLREEQKKHSA